MHDIHKWRQHTSVMVMKAHHPSNIDFLGLDNRNYFKSQVDVMVFAVEPPLVWDLSPKTPLLNKVLDDDLWSRYRIEGSYEQYQ